MDSNVVKVTNAENNIKIEEQGYLMVSDRDIGVTNSVEDIASYIQKQGRKGEVIYILPGYKDDLLKIQQGCMLQDSLCCNADNDKVEIPPRFTNWNLVTRDPRNNNALFRRISR